MNRLLLLLLLANIFYFGWNLVVDGGPERGVRLVDVSELGPPLPLARNGREGTDDGAALAAERLFEGGCVSIGPFAMVEEAEALRVELLQAGMLAEARATDGQLFVGYWVQLQDIENRAEASVMLERLHGSGSRDLADAYLLPTEDEGLRISLGLFGQTERAERVLRQAEELELEPVITRRMRDAEVFYVDLDLREGRDASGLLRRFGSEQLLTGDDAVCPDAP